MAGAKLKSKSKKPAVKDLRPKNARSVKGGDTATTNTTTSRADFSNLTITKVVDKTTPN